MQFESDRPIWVQLTDIFQRRIVRGQWAVGQKIPSVRELALELGVNPNTVQKALGELDRMGLTASERTSGRFVTNSQPAIDSARGNLAEELADTFVASTKEIGLKKDAALRLVGQRWELAQQKFTPPSKIEKL